MSAKLQPLVIEPGEKEVIWGGHALATRFGKPADPAAKIGESWECWDDNRVAGGPFAGKTLAQLRAELGRELTGRVDPAQIFPLLTKLIDARHALSVQVHPDDAYAQRVEGQPNGKTECWYILEADREAKIVLGWNRDTSRGEYLERVKDGSLGELLRHVPVHPGDTFHLPAGTLHAIGAGIVLFEVQQASDLTYRIFDYNRLGPDGKPRALHVDKAADVLDYRRSVAGPLRPLTYELDGLRRTTLVADSRFAVERVALDQTRRGCDLEGAPLVVLALDQPVELEAQGHAVRLESYQTGFVPAALEVVMLRAFGPEPAAVLTAAPLRDRDQLPRRYARAAVDVVASTDFLAQF
ncbi:MAG: type I phosphomannose isomerase catalytic subunit [Vulcanimicrobiaceae bacterium]